MSRFLIFVSFVIGSTITYSPLFNFGVIELPLPPTITVSPSSKWFMVSMFSPPLYNFVIVFQ